MTPADYKKDWESYLAHRHHTHDFEKAVVPDSSLFFKEWVFEKLSAISSQNNSLAKLPTTLCPHDMIVSSCPMCFYGR